MGVHDDCGGDCCPCCYIFMILFIVTLLILLIALWRMYYHSKSKMHHMDPSRNNVHLNNAFSSAAEVQGEDNRDEFRPDGRIADDAVELQHHHQPMLRAEESINPAASPTAGDDDNDLLGDTLGNLDLGPVTSEQEEKKAAQRARGFSTL